MTSEEKIKSLKKNLRNAITSNNSLEALDIIKTLENQPVTLEILSKTKIGFTVNKLRKSSDNDEIKTRSKNLIKTWRKYLYVKKEATVNEDVKMEEGVKKKKEKSEKNKKKEKIGDNKGKDKKTESDGTKKREKQMNREDVRKKCKELLISALKSNLNESIKMSETPENLAIQLEEIIFQEFENTSERYRNRIRSRLANLKDKNNPELKEKFLRGEITVAEMATMSFNEMANDKLKDMRKSHFYQEPSE